MRIQKAMAVLARALLAATVAARQLLGIPAIRPGLRLWWESGKVRSPRTLLPVPPVANTARSRLARLRSSTSVMPPSPILRTNFRTDSGRFGMFPQLRTSPPPASATATAIVSAWTSRPTKRTLGVCDQLLSYAALRRGVLPLRGVTRDYCEWWLVASF